jgi:hypothetical protein
MWLSRNRHWPNKRINSDKATALLVMRKRYGERNMTRKQHLRRVGITCLNCLRNLAYFRAAPGKNILKTKGIFWVNTHNNFLDIFVLEWCKLFGDKSGKHYWGKIITNQQSFFSSMLEKFKIDEAELEILIKEMRTYRDKFIAHLDLEPIMFIPNNLKLAQKSTEYLYNYILEKEDDGDFFNDAPSNAIVFFRNHLDYGKAEYQKAIKIP